MKKWILVNVFIWSIKERTENLAKHVFHFGIVVLIWKRVFGCWFRWSSKVGAIGAILRRMVMKMRRWVEGKVILELYESLFSMVHNDRSECPLNLQVVLVDLSREREKMIDWLEDFSLLDNGLRCALLDKYFWSSFNRLPNSTSSSVDQMEKRNDAWRNAVRHTFFSFFLQRTRWWSIISRSFGVHIIGTEWSFQLSTKIIMTLEEQRMMHKKFDKRTIDEPWPQCWEKDSMHIEYLDWWDQQLHRNLFV